MIKPREIVMIHELKNQTPKVTTLPPSPPQLPI